MSLKKEYDVVVLGAGIAGPLMALVLSRINLKVLVVESGKHPRFVIGESTIPTTTNTLKFIAETYNIPEIWDLTMYTEWAKEPAMADYPKAHFWFCWQKEGRVPQLADELLLETLDPPHGPDVHLMRRKVDQYLVSLFPKYGIDYVELMKPVNYEVDKEKFVHLTLGGLNKDQHKVRSRFVIDASGHAAFFSRHFNYFEKKDELSLKTNTRAIFAHFKSENLKDLEDILGGPCPFYRCKRSAGTMHHCFPGGWIWVIPFDEGTVSVGLVLDNNRFPKKDGVDPEEEFKFFIKQLPIAFEHLQRLEPLTKYISKSRSQIMSTSMLGPGVILTPHASAFIDPLFSSGILQTVTFIRNVTPLIKSAFERSDFNMEQFQPLEALFFRDIRHLDLIVSGVVESFRDLDVFRQFWRVWVAGTFYQTIYAIMREERLNSDMCGIYGANVREFREDVKIMWQKLFESRDQDQKEVAIQLKSIVDKHWLLPQNSIYAGLIESVGSKYPFKVFFKSANSFSRFSERQIDYVIKNTSYEGSSIMLRKRLAYFSNGLGFRDHIKDKELYRVKNLQAQRLPWYEVDSLK